MWPTEIEAMFNMYRVAVFFWILLGLVWLSGVISLVTEAIKTRGRSFGEGFGNQTQSTSREPEIHTTTVRYPTLWVDLIYLFRHRKE